MTILLLAEMETIWSEILISLFKLIPEFIALWFMAWLFRSLLMGKD